MRKRLEIETKNVGDGVASGKNVKNSTSFQSCFQPDDHTRLFLRLFDIFSLIAIGVISVCYWFKNRESLSCVSLFSGPVN